MSSPQHPPSSISIPYASPRSRTASASSDDWNSKDCVVPFMEFPPIRQRINSKDIPSRGKITNLPQQPTPSISIPHASSRSRTASASSDDWKNSNNNGNNSNDCALEFSPIRQRINSKDIPRTYSGLYGEGGENGDLLPFELTRNRNTEWVSAGGAFLRITYIFFITVIHIFTAVILGYRYTWTATNIIHGFVTMLCFHWIKGSTDFYDQGEMNAMTLWEQLSSNPDTDSTIYRIQKKVLFIIPAVLSYAGCHFADYNRLICVVNLSVWIICTVAKMDYMHGVRLLGINRTAGIDDYKKSRLWIHV